MFCSFRLLISNGRKFPGNMSSSQMHWLQREQNPFKVQCPCIKLQNHTKKVALYRAKSRKKHSNKIHRPKNGIKKYTTKTFENTSLTQGFIGDLPRQKENAENLAGVSSDNISSCFFSGHFPCCFIVFCLIRISFVRANIAFVCKVALHTKQLTCLHRRIYLSIVLFVSIYTLMDESKVLYWKFTFDYFESV